jgi:mono/diheme cytochrome c family protein
VTVRRCFWAGALWAALTALCVHAEDKPAVAAASPGETLFLARCGLCHLERGTGTIMLGRRLGPDHALLAERADLRADYVRAIVRTGINSMPALTRVEVNDTELDAIANYLSHAKPKRSDSK